MQSHIAGRSPFISVRPPSGAADEAPASAPSRANVPPGGPPVDIEPVEPPSYREALELRIGDAQKLVAAMELVESSLRKGLEGFDAEAQKFLAARAAGIPSAAPLSPSAAELVARHDLVSTMHMKLDHPRQKLLALEGEMRHQFPVMALSPGLVRVARAETGPLPAQAVQPPPTWLPILPTWRQP
jgi:hypothetical protein